MRATLNFACIIMIAGLLISGCASSREPIAKASFGSRQDVFSEVLGKDVPTGKAIIDLAFSVKSNAYYFIGMYGKHSDPPYRVHLDIDGQTTVLETEPVLEDKSPTDPKVPDSGIGWKYQFNKRIVLAPGKHKLTIALPIDGVIVEQETFLREGVNTVSLKPIYKMKSLRPYKGKNFTAGVKSVEVLVE